MTTFASVCSGVAGMDQGLERAGLKPIWMCEIDRQCREVLRYHYPTLPIYQDMTKLDFDTIERPDVLCGGTPCQSFSVAGLRQGMNDPRGNLTTAFLGVINKLQPKSVIWENVPGVISDKTKALYSFCDGLSEIGYVITGLDILDSQFFGVAQRRKRLFICAQNSDHLLAQRTPLSAVILIQCVAEILRNTLAVLSARLTTAPPRSESEKQKDVSSLKKKMILFGLQREERVRMSLECLAVLHPSYGCTPDCSGFQDGKSSLVDTKTLMDIGSRITGGTGLNMNGCASTGKTWRIILEDALKIASGCIMSMEENETTESAICSCAKAILTITRFMLPLSDSLDGFSTAAVSCLTTLQDYTNYARTTGGSLLGEMGRIRWWQYFEQEAQAAGTALGNIRVECTGKIFPLSKSLRGHHPPREKERQRVAGTLGSRATGGGGLGTDFDLAGGLQVAKSVKAGVQGHRHDPTTDNYITVPPCAFRLNAHGQRIDMESETLIAHTLKGEGFDASEDGTGRGTPLVTGFHGGSFPSSAEDQSLPLTSRSLPAAIAYRTSGNCGPFEQGDKTAALNTATDPNQTIIAFTQNASGRNNAKVFHPVAIRLAQTSSNGCGIDESGTSYTLDGAQGQAVGFVRRITLESLTLDCFCDILSSYGTTIKADADKILPILQCLTLQEKDTMRKAGGTVSLQSEEILQPDLHGRILGEPEPQQHLRDHEREIPRQEEKAERAMREVREGEREGCPPQGREREQQPAIESDADLQGLPQQDSPAKKAVRDLRQTAEGSRLLLCALSEVQKMGRPASGKGEPVRRTEEGQRPDTAEEMFGLRKGDEREGLLWAMLYASQAIWNPSTRKDIGVSPVYGVRRLTPL